MPKSAAFARIKDDVLQIVNAIPERKLCTYRAIGEHLRVMPRHVAYILSQLKPEEKMIYPWHRVVSDDGGLGVVKRHADGKTQAEVLEAEGLVVSKNSVDASIARALLEVSALGSGVAKQTRPADRAPAAAPSTATKRKAPSSRTKTHGA
jgi:methylated-DNA-protein-cysteine methyltransferase related protein